MHGTINLCVEIMNSTVLKLTGKLSHAVKILMHLPFEVYVKLKHSNIIWKFLVCLTKKSKMANTLSSDFFIAQF